MNLPQQSEEVPIKDLMELVQQIVAFHMKVWFSNMLQYDDYRWHLKGFFFCNVNKSQTLQQYEKIFKSLLFLIIYAFEYYYIYDEEKYMDEQPTGTND